MDPEFTQIHKTITDNFSEQVKKLEISPVRILIGAQIATIGVGIYAVLR